MHLTGVTWLLLALAGGVAKVHVNAQASDEPVSVLLDRADKLMALGKSNDALGLFSQAIDRDSGNYLTYFKRATVYLAVSRHRQALADLARALDLKPDFQAAKVQRGKTLTAIGSWDDAEKALGVAGDKAALGEVKAARAAGVKAAAALDKGDAAVCVEQATTAIGVATSSAPLRMLRAKCLLRQGQSEDAVSDLVQAVRLDPTSSEAQLLSAAVFFYALDDPERANGQVKACLHYDPDDKLCKRTFRTQRRIDKLANKVAAAIDSRGWTTAKRALRGYGEEDEREEGVLELVEAEQARLVAEGFFTDGTRLDLLQRLDVMACEVYAESKDAAAGVTCGRALQTDPESVGARRGKATILMKQEQWEEAVKLLQQVAESTGNQDRKVVEQLQKAQKLLKQSKQKDYYKVLDVSRDADLKSIKKQYRKLTKIYHPDKYRGDMNPDQVSRKIEQINEAWEVLSNPELRRRFDNGDDPNAPPDQGHNPFAHHGFAQGSPFGGGGGGQQFFFQQGGGGGGGGGFPGGGGGGFPGGFKFHFQQ